MRQALLSSLASLLVAAGAAGQDRPFDARDLVAMARVSDLQAAPDRRTLAFVLRETDMEANRGRTDVWLLDLAVLTGYFGLFSLGRFVYTLYGYGHHLDPTAPIRMEGFMPPVIGTRQIANFSVSSFPGLGTLLISVFGAAVLGVAFYEAFLRRERSRAYHFSFAPLRKATWHVCSR